MLFIAENLKALRKGKELTQEEVAEIFCVSAQSVSKWERGETFPDITLLPALSNFYKISVDELLGMDKINDIQTKRNIFTKGHKYLREGNITAAVKVYSEALKMFPNDQGFISELAMTLALDHNPINLSKAVTLCKRILSDFQDEQVYHTTRAALCFIYLKIGEKEKAVAAARKLPHVRESRETILTQLEKEPSTDDIGAYLKFIAIGDCDQQDIITIDFGVNIIPICTDYDLCGKIEALRKENEAQNSKQGYRKLPMIRVRDNVSLRPNQIRLRYYADYLINKEFSNVNEAVNEIIKKLQKIAQE